MFIYLKKFFQSKFKYIYKIKKLYIYIFILSIFLCVLSIFINKKSIFDKENSINRKGYGGGKYTYDIKVNIGKDVKNENITFDVSNKRYSEKEIKDIFEYAFDDCVKNVLKDNKDFEHIEYDLNFFTSYKEGIDVVWNFYIKDKFNIEKSKKYYRLVEENGKVNNDLIDEEYVEGYIEFYLKGYINDNDKIIKSDKYVLPIIILPKIKSEKEVLVEKLLKKISENDINTINENYIELPMVLDDKKVKYVENIDYSFLLIPFIGILIIFLLMAKEKNDVRQKEKLKKKELLIAYPKIINKLLIYISSGMTIRNSIYKIGIDYKERIDSNLEKKNLAYDKLYEAKNSLENGMIESKVYENVAKELNDKKYNRFFNLLIQNIKNGTKDFRNILEIEAKDSLLEKKNNAKKLGEEASTKLIIPLLLELMIIMLVIVVPAFVGI